MKNPTIYCVLSLALICTFGACTMGDKGSERVPDSIRIDTVQKPAAQEMQQDSGKALIDSLQTDTGQFPSNK